MCYYSVASFVFNIFMICLWIHFFDSPGLSSTSNEICHLLFHELMCTLSPCVVGVLHFLLYVCSSINYIFQTQWGIWSPPSDVSAGTVDIAQFQQTTQTSQNNNAHLFDD